MEFQKTAIKDCFVITPKVFRDDRGYFMENYNQNTFFDGTGLKVNFVQDNISESSYGVIRGLHAQRGEHAQAKLVSVLKGEVLDVVVDLRKDSSTHGKVVTAILNDDNKKQLFAPRGCFHGFAVLSEKVTFFYKCDNFYNKEADYGIFYNDESLLIDWQIPLEKRILSEKDQHLPLIANLK